MSLNGMLLCAGLGTRFRPHTEKLAKPALPFLGVPLAGFPLFYLEAAGLSHLAVNTHYLPKTVQSNLQCFTEERGQYDVRFLNESPDILGSGGGIANAKNLLLSDNADAFVVANGDEVMIAQDDQLFQRLVKAHRKSGALATLLLTEHPEAGKSLGAVVVDESAETDGKLVNVRELGARTAGPLSKHFCGVFVFSKKIFDFFPRGKKDFHIFKDCLTPAIQRGEKVMGFLESDLAWMDVTDEKSYIRSTESALEILSGGGPKAEVLARILERFQQNFTRDSRGAWLGAGAVLGPTTEVKGFAVLCAGAHFEQGILENAVVGPHLHIHEMVALRRQLVI